MANRIIIIEDEPLIAADIEYAVSDAGSEVVGTARTVDEGLDLLRTVICDGALLDANLNGKSAKPVMEQLEAQAVPYVVVSGYTRGQLEFLKDDVVLIGKPFSMAELEAAIRKHLTPAP